jgi:hypothetical protein
MADDREFLRNFLDKYFAAGVSFHGYAGSSDAENIPYFEGTG